jgi:hypothetical protein
MGKVTIRIRFADGLGGATGHSGPIPTSCARGRAPDARLSHVEGNKGSFSRSRGDTTLHCRRFLARASFACRP